MPQAFFYYVADGFRWNFAYFYAYGRLALERSSLMLSRSIWTESSYSGTERLLNVMNALMQQYKALFHAKIYKDELKQ